MPLNMRRYFAIKLHETNQNFMDWSVHISTILKVNYDFYIQVN